MHLCNSCHSGCCRRYIVDLTGYDILNISQHLALDPEYFVQLRKIDEDNVDYHSKYCAMFKFTDFDLKDYYRFTFKKIESLIFPGVITCLFLQENITDSNIPNINNVTGRCKIYGIRPLNCAAYPAKLDKSETRAIMMNYDLKNVENENWLYNGCSRELRNEDFAHYKHEIIKTVIIHKYELDFFKTLAKHWNQEPSSLKSFYEYIKNVYDNRVICENDLKEPAVKSKTYIIRKDALIVS